MPTKKQVESALALRMDPLLTVDTTKCCMVHVTGAYRN